MDFWLYLTFLFLSLSLSLSLCLYLSIYLLSDILDKWYRVMKYVDYSRFRSSWKSGTESEIASEILALAGC